LKSKKVKVTFRLFVLSSSTIIEYFKETHFFLFNQYSLSFFAFTDAASLSNQHLTNIIIQLYSHSKNVSYKHIGYTQRKSKQSVYSCSLIVTLNPIAIGR